MVRTEAVVIEQHEVMTSGGILQDNNQTKQATREAKAASAAGTNNAAPALSIVGDGAGAPSSSAAVTLTLEQATRTIKTTVRTGTSFKVSITKVKYYFKKGKKYRLLGRVVCFSCM